MANETNKMNDKKGEESPHKIAVMDVTFSQGYDWCILKMLHQTVKAIVQMFKARILMFNSIWEKGLLLIAVSLIPHGRSKSDFHL